MELEPIVALFGYVIGNMSSLSAIIEINLVPGCLSYPQGRVRENPGNEVVNEVWGKSLFD